MIAERLPNGMGFENAIKNCLKKTFACPSLTFEEPDQNRSYLK